MDFPWEMRFDFKCVISNYAVMTTFMRITSVAVFRWMAQGTAADESILVQVKAWCHWATGVLHKILPKPMLNALHDIIWRR